MAKNFERFITNKKRNLISTIAIFSIFIISLLIIIAGFSGLRIMSFLFLAIIFALSFNFSSILNFKNENNINLGITGFAIGFSTTLVWLIVNELSHTRITFDLGIAFLAIPLLFFYSFIGFLGGVISGWIEKKIKSHNILKIAIILLPIFLIIFTVNKDQQLLNQYNADGIFCDKFEINFNPNSFKHGNPMYLTLFGNKILKSNCKMDEWSNIIKKYPDIKIMDDAIVQKNPNKCEEIENKKFKLTENYRFVPPPIRGLVYASQDLNNIYDECIYASILTTKNQQLCIKLSKKQLREDCYFDVAMLTSNKTLCEKTSNQRGMFDFGSFRELCYKEVEKVNYPKGYFDKEAEVILMSGSLKFFDK